MDSYKTALDKIKASQNFKTETVHMLSNCNKTDKQKSNKRLVPILAACLVLVFMLTFIFVPFNSNSGNNFTIKACAQEVTQVINNTDFTPISEISAEMVGFFGPYLSELAPQLNTGEVTDNPHISNKAFFSLSVEGENIKNIHFELNNGFFEVKDSVMSKIIDTTGEKNEHTAGMQNGFFYFETITLDYKNQINPIGENQQSDWVMINVIHPYNEKTDKQLVTEFLNLSAFCPDAHQELEDKEYFETTFENFLNEMYKDTEIYVTCEFENGQTLTKTLKLAADCEIIGTKKEYYLTGNDYEVKDQTIEKYELFEVYDYTVELCAIIE